MIVHCPSCLSRKDIPSLRADGSGTLVACDGCGHEWIESRALDRTPGMSRNLPVAAGQNPAAAEADLKRLVAAARAAQARFAGERRRRRVMTVAWAGLLLVAATPAACAMLFPEVIVRSAPAAIAFYDLIGRKVNVYGLEIRDVEVQHLLVDGKQVVAVKGQIANVTGSFRKIPGLRFGLRAKDNAEVYNWRLDTAQRPLRPGESTSFVTRVASPPESASALEIRFARADEIGSNATP
jgi:hypothetical protein